jgi:hypothetical protein
VDAGVAHLLGNELSNGSSGPPAAVHEIEAPGVQIAARRHHGRLADVVVVEGDARRAKRSKFGVAIDVPP